MSVAKNTFLFTAGTILSRVLGLVREAVLAGVFGASQLLDAFFVANRIPNMLREMLAEGALGSSFTQRYAKLKVEDPQRASELVFNMLSLVFCVVGLISCLGIIFSPQIVSLLTLAADERSSEFYSNTIFISRFLFPFILVMSLTSVVTGVLHQRGKFFVSAVSPIALNLGYISGALGFSYLFENNYSEFFNSIEVDPKLFGLAFGVMLGGIGQGLWQAIPIIKELLPKGKISLLNEDTKKVLFMMGPMILGASAGQINVLVNTNFATSLEAGAVSWLSLSFRILQLPIGLFGVAIASVILPSLTKKISQTGSNASKEVGAEFQNAFELVIWLMAPCMIGIMFAGEDIISVILRGGKFDDHATSMTGQALSAYGIGVVGYGLIKVLTNYFYATGRTKFPMKVSFVSIFLNFAINYYLVGVFGHVGLAYTAASIFTFNALFLLWGVREDGLQINKPRLVKSLFFALLASLITGAGCYFVSKYLGSNEVVLEAFSFLGSSALKAKSAALSMLILKAAVVATGFGVFAALYLRITPKRLLALAKSKARRK